MIMSQQNKTYIRLLPVTHLQVVRMSIAEGVVLTTEEVCRFIDETLAERGRPVISPKGGTVTIDVKADGSAYQQGAKP